MHLLPFDYLLSGDVLSIPIDADCQLHAAYLTILYATHPKYETHVFTLLGACPDVPFTLSLLRTDLGQLQEICSGETTERETCRPCLEFESEDVLTSMQALTHELLGAVAHGRKHSCDSKFVPFDSPVFSIGIYLKWTLPALVVLYHRCLRHIPTLPVATIIEGLLYTEQAVPILHYFIANNPALCQGIIHHLVGQADTTSLASVKQASLLRLAELSPTVATLIREEAVSQQKGAKVIFHLTRDVLQDTVDFLSSMLTRSGEFLFQWLKSQPALCATLADELLKGMDAAVSVRACAGLRLYCSLFLLHCVPLPVPPAHAHTLALRCQSNPSGPFFRLFLCFCILCLPECGGPSQQHCYNVLQQVGHQESHREVLVLIATYYHAQQPHHIVQWLRDQLRITTKLEVDLVMRSATQFMNAIVPLDVLVRLILALSPRDGVTQPGADVSFVVKGVTLLLHSGVFQTHGVDVSGWVYDMVIERLHPQVALPSAIASLISELVDSTMNCDLHFSMTIWSEYQIMRVLNPMKTIEDASASGFHTDAMDAPEFFIFEGEDDMSDASGLHMATFDIAKLDLQHINRCIAVILYVLLVQSYRADHTRAEARGYGNKFVASLPLKYILLQAQGDPAKYGAVLPRLLTLLSTQHGHLLSVPAILRSFEAPHFDHLLPIADRRAIKSQDHRPRDGSSRMDLEEADEASEAAEPAMSLEMLEKTSACGLWHLLLQRDWWIDDVLPSLLQLTPDEGRAMARAYLRGWQRLADHLPEVVFPRTLLALLPGTTKLEPDLSEATTMLLQVDPRVFHDVSLVQLYLEVATFFLHAAEHQVASVTAMDPSHMHTLILAQRSSVLQLLLEVCVANAADNEVVVTICQFLHQQFIIDPMVCRLVHFQMYPPGLLPVLVRLIPSMHVVFDFIPDLMAHSALPQQVFAVQMTGELIQTYAIPRAVECAKASFDKVQRWIDSLNSPLLPSGTLTPSGLPDEGLSLRIAQSRALVCTLPSLAAMSSAYPPLMPRLFDCLVSLKAGTLEDELAKAVEDAFERIANGILKL